MVRSGFVSVVGRPNVGKSTLVNALVGQKVSITSQRPQTTRNTIRGVVTDPQSRPPGWQMVLVDTPGLHRPRNELGDRLNRLVYGALADADVVAFLVDVRRPVGRGDQRIAERLAGDRSKVVVLVNKTDRFSKEKVASHLLEVARWDFAAYVPISALRGDNLGAVIAEISSRLPEGPMYFPPGSTTDQPDSFFASEVIREKFLPRLHHELPHSLLVAVEDFHVRGDGLVTVVAKLVVESPSQKGIVIGKAGGRLQEAGSAARRELEVFFGAKVYLDLRVVVEKKWQRRSVLLDRFGF
ncbi:MAG: GTPase Era [Acidimicrobiia bacterium]|nr:GTPase Era [Acidimicrobiia bacterium]